MMRPIEVFERIPLFTRCPDSGKLVACIRTARCFLPHDLSAWGVHGDPSDAPFFDEPRRRHAWTVAHLRTGRGGGNGLSSLPFRVALEVAAALDGSDGGWSQVSPRLEDASELTGLNDALMTAFDKTLDRFGRAGHLPRWTPRMALELPRQEGW